MKDKEVVEWESQWSSERRREQIVTERARLEQERLRAGWRRNWLLIFVVALVVVAVLMLRVS